MATSSDPPWSTGPREILSHAIALLEEDSDTNRRLAMILTDNAVEQMIKTYLGLPKRITGLAIPRKRRDEFSESFPLLLDALEEFASDKLDGIDLGSVEWYHRLRNELYHQGFGLTVERRQVEVYAELANLLFRNLFGSNLLREPIGSGTDRLGSFIELWNHLEAGMKETAGLHHFLGERPRRVIDAITFLKGAGMLEATDVRELQELRQLRNQVVHSLVDYNEVITDDVLSRLKQYVGLFENPEDNDVGTDAG